MNEVNISVIMSVYNGEMYLAQAIESILGQTYGDFELIIINDHSDDGTNEIINSYLSDKRISVILNRKNIGITASLNKGIRQSKGKYIARHDADDISAKSRFEKQISIMEHDPKIGVLGTAFYEIDNNSKIIGEVHVPLSDLQIRKCIFKINPFNHSTVMIKRSVFKNMGLYNEKFINAQDYELWFRILTVYEGKNLGEKLLLKRNPDDSITILQKRRQIFFTIKAWQLGKKYLKPATKDYLYYIKWNLLYLIPGAFIPIIRKYYGRSAHTKKGKYYVVELC
jgi:glycosyltransferase involved in cell wall biosynthesis